MPSGPTRRAVLAAVPAASAVTLTGCSISVGTTDLVVQNCLEEDRTVDVDITHADGETVFSEAIPAPARTCGHSDDYPEREDVFPRGGEYAIRVEATGFDPVEETREFADEWVEENEESISVTLEEDGVVIS